MTVVSEHSLTIFYNNFLPCLVLLLFTICSSIKVLFHYSIPFFKFRSQEDANLDFTYTIILYAPRFRIKKLDESFFSVLLRTKTIRVMVDQNETYESHL